MADIKWVKIATDIFDNRKIKYIRSLKHGNEFVLIWIMLMTMAGRCNDNGNIYITEDIGYTEKTLGDELNFSPKIISEALSVFSKLSMINGMQLLGWEEYQNVEGMEKVREQTKNRVKKYRSKLNSNVTVTHCNAKSNVTVTQGNATDIDIDIDIDKDIKEKYKEKKKFTPPTLEELTEYTSKHSYNIDCQQFIDFYQSKGWKVGNQDMKDWKAAVRTWAKRDIKPVKSNKFNNFEQRTDDLDSRVLKKLNRKLVEN